ncbi:MAG: Clp1/GlmU family protein [Candidatus Methanodesulfokora sp.]
MWMGLSGLREVELTLKSGEGIIFNSPAEIRVINGDVEVWGAKISGELRIEGEAPLLIESSSESRLMIRSFSQPIETRVPDSWKEVEKTVDEGIIIFIGSSDSGKSSMIAYLANKLVARGLKVGIVDSDIGQKDIGPVGTISSAVFSDLPIIPWLREPDKMYFIGDKTPRGHMLPMVVGVKLLVDMTRADALLINTTGYVSDDAAVELKLRKIEAIQPDLVVGIEDGSLRNLLPRIPHFFRKIQVKAPNEIRKKSAAERMERRRKNVERYIRGSNEIELEMESLFIQWSPLGGGNIRDELLDFLSRELKVRVVCGHEGPSSIYLLAEDCPNAENIRRIELFTGKKVIVEALSNYINLYVGLLDDRGFCEGVGLLKGISDGKIRVLTRYSSKPRGLRFGFIKFSSNGYEMGRREICRS